MDEIRFYRATGQYGFLSNLYPAEIVFEGRKFRSSEDAYQYGKPKSPEVAEWLVLAPKPHLCAAAAHALFVFDIRPEWNSIKIERMRAVLLAKFTQHESLRLKLLETGDAQLIEASNTDAFWGIGKKGNGKNMLGVLLMDIRREFKGAGNIGEVYSNKRSY
ncbi:MAG TPA: DUF1768 domain-containing protein [Desulfobacterales bacterium]|nr:DUF1768 domain-containing protein [Desulfobacterales bacterium]